MTEIEQKALALLNEVAKEMELSRYASLDHNLPGHRALCRAIEQHEQFKREVSDAAVAALKDAPVVTHSASISRHLSRFILPKPVDPLLLKARLICAEHDPDKAYQYLEGQRDDYIPMTAVLAALKIVEAE